MLANGILFWVPVAVALRSKDASLVDDCPRPTQYDSHAAGIGQNLTIASMFSGYTAMWRFVWENHLHYAEKHRMNYFAVHCHNGFAHGDFPLRPGKEGVYYSKFAIIQYLFDEGTDIVFWMDADSMFVDDRRDLRAFLSEDRDLAFSGDMNVVFNSGHFLLRKSAWSRQFLRDSYAIFPAPDHHENGAMLAALRGAGLGRLDLVGAAFGRMSRCTVTPEEAAAAQAALPREVRAHVRVWEQGAMNSREDDGRAFILHGAGLPTPLKLASLAAAEAKQRRRRKLLRRRLRRAGGGSGPRAASAEAGG